MFLNSSQFYFLEWNEKQAVHTCLFAILIRMIHYLLGACVSIVLELTS